MGAAKVNIHHGPEHVRAGAKDFAERVLKEAARRLAIPPNKKGEHRFFFGRTQFMPHRSGAPEVVTVYESSTGQVWAVSAPGMPDQLCPNFKPRTPALEQSVIVDR
jgi:hypothetical protein